MITLGKNIVLFTDLFEDLSRILTELQDCNWQMWGRGTNDPNYKMGGLSFIKDNDYLSEQINFATLLCLNQYMEEFNIDKTLHRYDTNGIYIRKWDFPMGGITVHRDHTYDEKGNAMPVEYTLCGYLNDDYEGGLIEFPEHGISIKAPAGSAIIFPSQELHLVTDLVDKHRYMWSSFVYRK
jgi:hypothetical protein